MNEVQKAAAHVMLLAYTKRWRELHAIQETGPGWSQAEHYEITHIGHMIRVLGDVQLEVSK